MSGIMLDLGSVAYGPLSIVWGFRLRLEVQTEPAEVEERAVDLVQVALDEPELVLDKDCPRASVQRLNQRQISFSDTVIDTHWHV